MHLRAKVGEGRSQSGAIRRNQAQSSAIKRNQWHLRAKVGEGRLHGLLHHLPNLACQDELR